MRRCMSTLFVFYSFFIRSLISSGYGALSLLHLRSLLSEDIKAEYNRYILIAFFTETRMASFREAIIFYLNNIFLWL